MDDAQQVSVRRSARRRHGQDKDRQAKIGNDFLDTIGDNPSNKVGVKDLWTLSVIQVSSNNKLKFKSGRLDLLFLVATVFHLIRDYASGQVISRFNDPWQSGIVTWQESRHC